MMHDARGLRTDRQTDRRVCMCDSSLLSHVGVGDSSLLSDPSVSSSPILLERWHGRNFFSGAMAMARTDGVMMRFSSTIGMSQLGGGQIGGNR